MSYWKSGTTKSDKCLNEPSSVSIPIQHTRRISWKEHILSWISRVCWTQKAKSYFSSRKKSRWLLLSYKNLISSMRFSCTWGNPLWFLKKEKIRSLLNTDCVRPKMFLANLKSRSNRRSVRKRMMLKPHLHRVIKYKKSLHKMELRPKRWPVRLMSNRRSVRKRMMRKPHLHRVIRL